MDRWTAEMVREGIARVTKADGDVGNMLEDFDLFLAYTDPYEDGEDRWPGVP
jgi:hypothetical protein